MIGLRQDARNLDLWFNDEGVLRICRATQEDETRVHKQLDAFRINEKSGLGRRSEWYWKHQAVLDAVKAVGPMISLEDTPARARWTGNRFRSVKFREQDLRFMEDAVIGELPANARR